MTIHQVIPRKEILQYTGGNASEFSGFWSGSTILSSDATQIAIRMSPSLGSPTLIVPTGSWIIRNGPGDVGTYHSYSGAQIQSAYLGVSHTVTYDPTL